MSPEQKLSELGLELPPAARPVGAYVPSVRAGALVFTAGQLPTVAGELIATGKVPADVSLPVAQQAARTALLNALGAVRAEIGTLEMVVRVVRMNVFVNSSPCFANQAQVANGASDLLLEVFHEAGKHTRCALGAAELPLNAPVELDLVVQVRDESD